MKEEVPNGSADLPPKGEELRGLTLRLGSCVRVFTATASADAFGLPANFGAIPNCDQEWPAKWLGHIPVIGPDCNQHMNRYFNPLPPNSKIAV